MGFSSFAGTLATTALSNAVALAGDFAPLIGLMVGLAAFGILLSIFGRFVSR